MSLVCWEIVPSIFTFSWEYTAYRKENKPSEKEVPRNTTLNKFVLRTHELGFPLSSRPPGEHGYSNI